MDWVEEFYARQDEWAGVYSGEVTDRERERIAQLEHLAGGGVKHILELGAGGGQAAAAAAEAGYQVTAIELVPTAAAHAQKLAQRNYSGSLTVLQGSFYNVDLPEQFDVVCYWDGFGVGTDQDQRHLLQRIADWLAPAGCALLDINTPWYWAHTAGREMRTETFAWRYGFDARNCRMLDCWWPPQRAREAVTQSLRCYSPADLTLLLEGTGLRLQDVVPGGAVDYVAGTYREQAPLEQAMQYTAKLVAK